MFTIFKKHISSTVKHNQGISNNAVAAALFPIVEQISHEAGVNFMVKDTRSSGIATAHQKGHKAALPMINFKESKIPSSELTKDRAGIKMSSTVFASSLKEEKPQFFHVMALNEPEKTEEFSLDKLTEIESVEINERNGEAIGLICEELTSFLTHINNKVSNNTEGLAQKYA